jgi:hypothetical protein
MEGKNQLVWDRSVMALMSDHEQGGVVEEGTSQKVELSD